MQSPNTRPQHGRIHGYQIRLAAILVLLACTAASCGHHSDTGMTLGVHRVDHTPSCAFGDPEFMTSFGVCNLVADYYVAHQQWPITRAQLDEQMQQWLERDKAQMSADEIHDASTFLDRFTLLEPRQHVKNLVFHYRFKIDQKIVDHTVTFRPGPTSDEILRSAAEGDHG